MAVSVSDICNMALTQLGEQPGATAPTAYFNTIWQNNILQPVLMRFPWNGIKNRISLVQPTYLITGGTPSGGTLTLQLEPVNPQNFVLQSQAGATSPWSATALTVTNNASTAPDGSATATQLKETAVTSNHYITQTLTLANFNNNTLTVSCYAKSGTGRNFIQMQFTDTAGALHSAFFNTSTGAVTVPVNCLTTNMIAVGNGWYQCNMIVSSGAGVSAPTIGVYNASASGTISYLGNTSDYMLVWGIDITPGAPQYTVTGQTAVTPVPYVATTTAVVSFAAAATFNVGQTVYVNGVLPTDYNINPQLTGSTANTISFASGAVDSYSYGGLLTWAPLFGWDYVYTLPGDCIRALQVNQIDVSNFYTWSSFEYYQIGSVMPPFKIEQGQLLSNWMTVDLLYLQLQNPPQDPILVDLLVARAAAELAFPVTHDNNIKQGMQNTYTQKLRDAMTVNAQQGTPDSFQEVSWLTVRY